MSIEEPDTRTFNEEYRPLNLEGYPEFYSTYWRARSTLDLILRIIDSHTLPDMAEAILYTDETPGNNVYLLRDALEILENEQPRFFRVDAEEYSVTWEDIGMSSIVGYISSSRDEDMLLRLYLETTEEELIQEERARLIDYLSQYE